MNKKLITMTFFSVLMSAFNTAQAEDEYYKWVDERGVTHYSETQPDDSKIKAERVNVSTYIPRGSEQAISNLQQQRSEKAETKKENKEGVTKTGAKTDVSKAPAEYKEKCATLKEDLTKLSGASSSIKVKEANGDVRALTADEIAKRTESTKSQIKIYCQ
jgi:hypothetical protein